MFEVTGHISDPGHTDKPNEDWLAFNRRAAIVCDGATGLGGERLFADAPSDAAWLARAAAMALVEADPEELVREMVRRIAGQARDEVAKMTDPDALARHAWPAAGFIMARSQAGMIEISGLGDCVALVRFEDGAVEPFCPLPGAGASEARAAAEDLRGRKGEALQDPQVLESLRRKRARLNTEESGVWTLGLEPAAAEHVMTIAIPAPEIHAILLMSDGFSCLMETYGRYSGEALFERALEVGLDELVAEIRRIERIEDPDARRYARYKQSDDSTAILLRTGK